MLPRVEFGGESCFAQRFVAARFKAEDLCEGPVRFKPVRMGGDGGAETALGTRGVVARGVDDREAVPGVEGIFGGASGALAGGGRELKCVDARGVERRLLPDCEKCARVPKVAGFAGRSIMYRCVRKIERSEIALHERERMIGEGNARGEIEQRERDGETAGRRSGRGGEPEGKRDRREEDGRDGDGEDGELLADDSGG